MKRINKLITVATLLALIGMSPAGAADRPAIQALIVASGLLRHLPPSGMTVIEA